MPARDPVAALLRVRKLALEGAQRDLASCLRAEAAAEERERRARHAVAQEAAAAARLAADDTQVEAFAAWLPVGRQAVAEAEEDAGRVRAETACARAALSAARSAARAAEELLAQRAAERASEDARKAQAEIDGLPRRRFR